jgi:hypothetical protein
VPIDKAQQSSLSIRNEKLLPEKITHLVTIYPNREKMVSDAASSSPQI